MSTSLASPGSAARAGFSPSRVFTVFWRDLQTLTQRPLFWIWAALLVLSAWGLSTGSMTIQSGDTSVGGTRAWITSEFAVAKQLSILTPLAYAFFLAILAGMTIIQDEQWRLGDLLHSTPLRPGEYVWGKFAAVLTGALTVLAVHLLAMAVCFHVLPSAAGTEIRGPFVLLNYIRPALVFSAPMIVFLTGCSLAVGEWTRRTILVFLLPLAILMIDLFFLWSWSPSWLDPRINRALMLIEPGGFRWLNETWMKVDRGASFYNHEPIHPDPGFLSSRLAFILLGLGAVAWSHRHFARTLRDPSLASWRADRGRFWHRRAKNQDGRAPVPTALDPARGHGTVIPASAASEGSLASLGMTGRRPGLITGAWYVACNEVAELVFSPGLYLFVPLILLQCLGQSLVQTGYLDTPLLVTSGSFAVSAMSQLATCVCLLLLWYTVESLDRENSTRLDAICHAAPIRTGSLLLGKAVALASVATAIVAAAGAAGLVVILIQGRAPLDLRPMGLVWALLLLPTFLVWTAFIILVQTVARNRYTTYAVGLGVFGFTAYRLFTKQINWVGNWVLWDAIRWSDISILEIDRRALVLSRLLAVSLAALFLTVTVRLAARRDLDPTRILHRMRPRALLFTGLALLPWAVFPIAAGVWLGFEISRGHGGAAAAKRDKDYWRKNLATYHDARVPDLSRVDLDLVLFPATSRFRVSGTYDMVNPDDAPLRELLLTGGGHWEQPTWTFEGKPFAPTDRAGLFVFTPPRPLQRGEHARIGFQHAGALPRGISKKGGSADQFILPSAVVLTSFEPTFVPVVGYRENIGVNDDNRLDAKEYPDGFHEGQTDSFVGARKPFTTRITITGPAEFTLNSVGVKTGDVVRDGRRTVVWESDHPVNFFNVVAGRWNEKKGDGTAVFYHPGHEFNVDEILGCLDAARRRFSAWFFPYPWKELKLSEFPGLATYAQGFPTNISFSEGVGFLTESTPKIHFAFEITAHEAAHQWWGNILSPGKGPGAVILAEGMAHFSTILLVEAEKGPNARIDFCKRLEDRYATNRHPDAERPLVKTDGYHDGDTTVIYEKGGWVFWMLLQHMGRDRALQGLQAFITTYRDNPDHPVLQDFLEVMRRFAPEPAAFDAFARQWFFEKALPEYRLHEPKTTINGDRRQVTVRIENAGSGTMPVEVAATRGERFDRTGQPSPDYHETRVAVNIGPGESRELVIDCPFEPDSLVVDPDALVLQLQRKAATIRLSGPPAR